MILIDYSIFIQEVNHYIIFFKIIDTVIIFNVVGEFYVFSVLMAYYDYDLHQKTSGSTYIFNYYSEFFKKILYLIKIFKKKKLTHIY